MPRPLLGPGTNDGRRPGLCRRGQLWPDGAVLRRVGCVACGLVLSWAGTGCTSSSPGPQPTRASTTASTTGPAVHASTLHVLAVLESTHPDADGRLRRHHAPLVGESVIVTRSDGSRRTGPINASGHATVRLEPGRYVVSTSERGACPPATIKLVADEVRTLDLACIAP